MNFESNSNYFSSSSFHRGAMGFSQSQLPKDATKSKAYLNAMRSLQEKIKELEKEKASWLIEKEEIISTVEKEYQEIMNQYRKEIDEYLTKEFEYKEKIRLMEDKLQENEGRLEDYDERTRSIQNDLETRLQGTNRELIEMRTKVQEEVQTNENLKIEIKELKEKNMILNDKNERNLKDYMEERDSLEERFSEIESKYQGNLIEIQELKSHYSHEINDYQEELLRIQGKYQRELEDLLLDKDQILMENRKLFNELNLKDEDLNIFRKKIENLTFEKKKDDMYKQIMNEFQISRNDSGVFMKNPLEIISRNNFPGNVNEIIKNKIKNKKRQSSSSSSRDNSNSNEKIEKNSAKKKEKKKKQHKKKKMDINSSDINSENDNLDFYKEREMQTIKDLQNFKEIISLENEIKQTNQKYNSLMIESQATLDSQEKAKIRQKLFVLNETLNKANEKLLSLKKIQGNMKLSLE